MIRNDYDGLLTLFLSTTLIVLLLGVTYFLTFVYVLLTAFITSCNNKNAQHIVVLGKKLKNNLPDNDYQQRLDRAISLIPPTTNKNIYILGGITGAANISEARAGKDYLEGNNIQTRNIFLEEGSQNTLENMKHFKAFTTIPDMRICLITNRYHIARSSIMAEGFGFVVEKCAAENTYSPHPLDALVLLVEAFHLHWYLTGRTYAKLTHNQRMLSRIQ